MPYVKKRKGDGRPVDCPTLIKRLATLSTGDLLATLEWNQEDRSFNHYINTFIAAELDRRGVAIG